MKFQLHIITQQGSYDVTLLIQIRGSGWFITLMVWKIYHGKIEVTSVVLQHTDDLALEVTLLLCALEDKIESKGFVSFMLSYYMSSRFKFHVVVFAISA
jgi:hypothetical protein